MDERVERSRELYEQVIFGAAEGALTQADRELDAVEADLVLARGRVLHGRFLEHDQEDPHELASFQRAAELYRSLGDERGEAEALFWIGCFHQVVRKDAAGADDALRRSANLARKVGDRLTLSYALRHLGIADHQADRLDEARAKLEESTALRRELGFDSGAAANLVGLVYLAAAQGRIADARTLADEARTLAEGAGATKILTQITEARARI